MRHLGYTIFSPEMLISGCLTQHMDVLNYEITENGLANVIVTRD